MTSIQSGFANLTAHQRPIVGDIKMSVVNVDHLGWLICDGRSLPVNDFLFLYNVIGYSFGGSGSNFNLPNPAGRTLGVLGQGVDANPTLSTATFTLGGNYGEYNHLLTLAEIPSHNHDIVYNSSNTWPVGSSSLTGAAGSHSHSITDPGHTHNYTASNSNSGLAQITGTSTRIDVDNSGGELNLDAYTSFNINSNTTGITVNSNGDHQHEIWAQGGNQYHNNVQPTIGLGNIFIYSGLPTYPTIFQQSYNGWPNFYQGVTPGVYLPNPPLQ
jgi:microcystin-dependent protein